MNGKESYYEEDTLYDCKLGRDSTYSIDWFQLHRKQQKPVYWTVLRRIAFARDLDLLFGKICYKGDEAIRSPRRVDGTCAGR